MDFFSFCAKDLTPEVTFYTSCKETTQLFKICCIAS